MTTKPTRAQKLKNKNYRKAFVASHANVNIPYQIRALRKQRGWEQSELAIKANMKQPAISRLEKPGYGQTNLDTLIRLANAFDVGLVVRFAPYSEMLAWSTNFQPDSFAVPSFSEDQGLEDQSTSMLTTASELPGSQKVNSQPLPQPVELDDLVQHLQVPYWRNDQSGLPG